MTSTPRRVRPHDSWLTMLGITLVTFFGLGTPWYIMAVLFEPLVQDFGWGRGAYSVATSIHVVLSTVGSAPVGYMVDRWGARRVMLVSSLASGLAWLLMGVVGQLDRQTALWALYLLYGLLGIGAAGTGLVPAGAIIVRRFAGQRGRIMGLSIVGAGLPGMVLVPLAAPFIAAYGWRPMVVVLGVLVLLACIVACLWLLPDDAADGCGPRPAARPRRVPGISMAQALRAAPFWWISVAFLLSQFAAYGVQAHAVPYLIDRGLSPLLAAQLWAGLALAGVVGKITVGSAADHVSPAWLTLLSFGLQGAAVVAALVWPGMGGALALVVLSGLGMGGQMVIKPLLIERGFGSAAFGAISGASVLATLPGVAVGQLLAGYLYDATGSYSQSYIVFIVAFLVSMVALLPVMGLRREKGATPSEGGVP